MDSLEFCLYDIKGEKENDLDVANVMREWEISNESSVFLKEKSDEWFNNSYNHIYKIDAWYRTEENQFHSSMNTECSISLITILTSLYFERKM